MEVGKHDLPAVVSKKVTRMKGAPPHLLMVPFPAQPHIVPMLSLAKQIVPHGGITITFVSFQPLIDRLLRTESNASDAIHFVGVPFNPAGFDPPKDLPHNPKVLRETLYLGHCMGPYVNKLLQDQDNLLGPTCMITDWMNWWTADVAAKLGIPRYALCVCGAVTLQLYLQCPAGGYVFGEDGFKEIPGLPPFQSRHITVPCRTDCVCGKEFLTRWPRSVLESDGVLLNTSLSVESDAIDAIRSSLPHGMPVLPIGPLGLAPGLFQSGVSMEGLQLSDENQVIDWLNEQPPVSVLYIGFGTTGMRALTTRHVMELARGLEASGQQFLWVFRAPSDGGENETEWVPPGFEERMKGRGLLLRGWAPQLKILAHPSTGAFLSSCGWNSSIESLALGVPLIGWPTFADQAIICRLLEASLKVAITLPFGKDFLVRKEDFTKAINVVLQSTEGTTMRERMRNYKTQIGADLLPGGSSHEAIRKFADQIRQKTLPT